MTPGNQVIREGDKAITRISSVVVHVIGPGNSLTDWTVRYTILGKTRFSFVEGVHLIKIAGADIDASETDDVDHPRSVPVTTRRRRRIDGPGAA